MTSHNKKNKSAMYDDWVRDDENAPVALHLRQPLVPVEGRGTPIFPATYAQISYNIDELEDGTKVASIDSVGSQANRIESIFLKKPYCDLVPQINISYGNGKSISILETGHRLGDAVIRCTKLAEKAREAFKDSLDKDDVTKLAKLAPTSLVFGVWDSRDTNEKHPRLVQSVIRAWGVSKLTRSAQYFPPLDYVELDVLSEEKREKEEGKSTSSLAQRGYVHVPSVNKHGGVTAEKIHRDITLNLVALRRLNGEDSNALRGYILGLSLVSVTAPFDGFLRSGCLLVPPEPDDNPEEEICELVYRDGTRNKDIRLSHKEVLDYATKKANTFKVEKKPQKVEFDKNLAKKDTQKGKKKGKEDE